MDRREDFIGLLELVFCRVYWIIFGMTCLTEEHCHCPGSIFGFIREPASVAYLLPISEFPFLSY